MAPRGWIAVHRDLANSGLVGHGMDDLGIPGPHVVGLLVTFWCHLHESDRDGAVNDVTDALIEQWAGWTGERGRFARFLRQYHVGPDGRVKDWDEWQSREAHARQQHARRQAAYRSRAGGVTAKRHARRRSRADAGDALGDVRVTTNRQTDITNKGGTAARARAREEPPLEPSDTAEPHDPSPREPESRELWQIDKDQARADAQLVRSIGEKLALHGGPQQPNGAVWPDLSEAEKHAWSRLGGASAIYAKYSGRS